MKMYEEVHRSTGTVACSARWTVDLDRIGPLGCPEFSVMNQSIYLSYMISAGKLASGWQLLYPYTVHVPLHPSRCANARAHRALLWSEKAKRALSTEEILSTVEGATAFAKWAPVTGLFHRRPVIVV